MKPAPTRSCRMIEAMTIGPMPSVASVPMLDAVISWRFCRNAAWEPVAMPSGFTTLIKAKMSSAKPVHLSRSFSAGFSTGGAISGRNASRGLKTLTCTIMLHWFPLGLICGVCSSSNMGCAFPPAASIFWIAFSENLSAFIIIGLLRLPVAITFWYPYFVTSSSFSPFAKLSIVVRVIALSLLCRLLKPGWCGLSGSYFLMCMQFFVPQPRDFTLPRPILLPLPLLFLVLPPPTVLVPRSLLIFRFRLIMLSRVNFQLWLFQLKLFQLTLFRLHLLHLYHSLYEFVEFVFSVAH